MPGRLIALGDIHGCLRPLETLLSTINPSRDDTLVFLGDYVDRGPDSRGVLDRLIPLPDQCQAVFLLGNHDEMMLKSRLDPHLLARWLEMGGAAALESYHVTHPMELPADHVAFLERCQSLFEIDTYFFVHALYEPALPLSRQPERALRWDSFRDHRVGPHDSEKTAIVGHTSQKSGEILDVGYLVCIDTYCYGGGWLTALDLTSRRVWQSDPEGRLRDGPSGRPWVRPGSPGV